MPQYYSWYSPNSWSRPSSASFSYYDTDRHYSPRSNNTSYGFYNPVFKYHGQYYPRHNNASYGSYYPAPRYYSRHHSTGRARWTQWETRYPDGPEGRGYFDREGYQDEEGNDWAWRSRRRW